MAGAPTRPDDASGTTLPASDGTDRPTARSPRAERSRTAIAEAALALVREGDTRPTAGRVAQRAGISERLIFHHFTDLEELWAAVAEQQVRELLARQPAVATTGPLDARIRGIVAARAEMNEWITPVRRASVVREPFSPVLAENRARLNRGSRVQVGEVFAPELGGRAPDDAEELLTALDLALSWPAWDALRTRGSSIERATRVVERTVRALLGA